MVTLLQSNTGERKSGIISETKIKAAILIRNFAALYLFPVYINDVADYASFAFLFSTLCAFKVLRASSLALASASLAAVISSIS